MDRPIIAVSMGDPSGVGPEIVARVVGDPSTYRRCRPVVVGDAGVLEAAARQAGIGVGFRPIANLAEADFSPDRVEVVRPAELSLGEVPVGMVDAAMGRAAGLCLETTFGLALAGQVQGVVLAPMNKQAFHLAGYRYFDELEYLAELVKSPETFILGAISPSLWTVAVTAHVPFRDVPGLVTRARVLRYTRYLDATLRKVGLMDPRLAVAALNVHGGEGGLFGREEIDAIEPAIRGARELGLDVAGPCPADTVFVRARAGEFQGVVCMYHDQANIARKLLATRRGATLFGGLPVPCGTTAHGTAHDIAGQGIADPGSLADALSYTIMLAGGEAQP